MLQSTKYVIANWKSNKTIASTKEWLTTFGQQAASVLVSGSVQAVIAPSFPLLPTVNEALQDAIYFPNCSVGVQDMSPFAAGSYTGAVSAENLKDLNVKYAIVGHSERRRYFHEDHQMVANKVAQCVEASITPVVCVDNEYIKEQGAAISKDDLSQCLVAYEELGAIGTGNNEDPAKVAEVVSRIKTVFGDVPVLYGGSVNPGNAKAYSSICEGVLVGGASLDAAKFGEIISLFSLP